MVPYILLAASCSWAKMITKLITAKLTEMPWPIFQWEQLLWAFLTFLIKNSNQDSHNKFLYIKILIIFEFSLLALLSFTIWNKMAKH